MKTRFLHFTYFSFTFALLMCMLAIPINSHAQLTCGSTISSYPYSESFESGIGAWTQSNADDFNWTRNSGGTGSSGTGPSSASDGSYYMYTESSSPNYPSRVAIFVSPCFDLTSVSNPSFNFDYSMYGNNMGTLELQASTNGSSWSTIWSLSGDQGTSWNSGGASLGAYSSTTVQLRFVATTGNGYRSDFAIDNIDISGTTPCSGGITSFPYTEGFESDFGLWSHDASDDFNWARRTGSTPSNNTGPSSAYEGSRYIYVEASNPNNPNKIAIINGPCIDLSSETGANFSFYYHMYGASSAGSLEFQVSTSNGAFWITEWSLSGNQGNSWQNASIDLSAYDGQSINIRIVATTGATWQSDMAVDDFEFTVASNSPPTAVNDNASTGSSPITIDVLNNDSDVNGDNITITAITVAPNHGGTAIINNNGTPGNPADDYIDFTPSGVYAGTETFTYQICDNGSPSLCATAVVSVNVSPNFPPTANADNATSVNQSITIDVLSNDTDPNPTDDLTITAITVGPNQGGAVSINNNGTPGNPDDDFIDYTPSGSFYGIETFTYQICDNGSPNLCATAVVSVNVVPNSNPIANSDNATTLNEPMAINVLGNDSDPNADAITITAITVAPNHGGIALINNNGTPGNPADDYIDYIPSGSYFGVETFTYEICDDGAPNLCATAMVSVTVNPNNAPNAVNDNASTSISSGPININVLVNDSDPNAGQTITLSGITTPPSNGGNAIINNNGTPGNPNDDYIVYTPSGAYIGTETFSYQICDDGTPNLCDIATVSVVISACPDPSSQEPSPNWPLNSYWKYDDSGTNLGTSWRDASFLDVCWSWGRANLGFGDTHNTTLTNHGGVTYYFRKHFNVADVTQINYLLLDVVRDDGAAVYINGTEVFRTNLPNGILNNTTLASNNVNGSEETDVFQIIVPASVLVNGNNVIAVEVHQDNPSSSDINFDLGMTADMVDHTGDIYIAQNQYWNYNDNGIDLGTTWSNFYYRETEDEWVAGNAEFGYGDGDEVTVVDYGPDANNKYTTTYFRHYFTAYDINNYDSLLINLRRDDGAIVYLNGQEVFRSGMPTGTVSYGTYANHTSSGSDEDDFQQHTFLASMIMEGTNVVTVEIHQTNASSSDISFELELTKIDGDPDTYVLSYESISGTVFLDLDVDRTLSAEDFGQGALEVYSYFDRDQDGEIDPERDPRLFSYLTNTDGTYEVDAYYSEIVSVKSDISASNEDAGESGLGGAISLNATTHKSLNTYIPAALIFDTLSTWKYYDSGDIGVTNWMNTSYNDAAWSSASGDFGFGDPGINTTLTSGRDTYYFRKSFTGGAAATTWNTIRLNIKRDDGVVIYLNGVEIARNNMPEGLIGYSTYAVETIEAQDEDTYFEIVVPGVNFNLTNNVIAVELHQRSAGSSDVVFDMSAHGEASAVTDVGYRFDNIDVPQGAKIVDAFLRLTAAEISEKVETINIEGQASDNAPAFTSVPFNISSRARTTASVNFTDTKKHLDGREIKISGLKNIVQEIVDRPGWNDGNALALILSGYEVQFYSYDGGHAPELTISYVDTTITSAQYLVGIQEEDLPVEFTYMTDPSPAATFGRSFRPASGLNIGYLGTTSMCVASSDDDYDGLHIINRFSGKNKYIGPFGGSTEIESIAFNANSDSLFAVDQDAFGLINTLTGAFTPYGNTIGTGGGADGNIDLDDIDGLAYDLDLNLLWATHRRSTPNHDLIFVIDPTTGQHIPDAFGSGIDYIIATGGGLLPDLDDIAVNPNTGNLFAMNNDNGNITNLVEIDISTGLPNVINPTGLNDMEGQGFHNDGLFYSTSGREGIPDNAFYRVDTSNSTLHLVGYFETEGDFEGCDCKSGPFVSLLEGTVFEDLDADGVLDDEDIVDPDVMVYLYEDLDGDSVISAGDILIDSFETDAYGAFFFRLDRKGTFLINVNYFDLPPNVGFTTPEQQEARLTANGNFDRGNDFGYVRNGLLPVELLTFYGENIQDINRLHWVTATETNNSHFDVLKSADAIHFTKIGTVDGAGNSNSEKTYSFDDEAPFNGINYYQLRQVDFDGTTDYSDIISLSNESSRNHIDISIWPNPTKDDVNLSGLLKLAGQNVNIEVLDIFGNVRIKTEFEVSNDNFIIDLDQLSSGYYIVKFTQNGMSKSYPFVKQ